MTDHAALIASGTCADRLLAFIRDMKPGGCNVLSESPCLCPLCDVDRLASRAAAALAAPVPDGLGVAIEELWRCAINALPHLAGLKVERQSTAQAESELIAATHAIPPILDALDEAAPVPPPDVDLNPDTDVDRFCKQLLTLLGMSEYRSFDLANLVAEYATRCTNWGRGFERDMQRGISLEVKTGFKKDRRVAAPAITDEIEKLADEIDFWLANQPMDPIGPLHGAGMAFAYKDIVKTLRTALAGPNTPTEGK